MAPPKFGDLGKKSSSLLGDDFKYDNKCEIKTKIASSGVVQPRAPVCAGPRVGKQLVPCPKPFWAARCWPRSAHGTHCTWLLSMHRTLHFCTPCQGPSESRIPARHALAIPRASQLHHAYPGQLRPNGAQWAETVRQLGFCAL